MFERRFFVIFFFIISSSACEKPVTYTIEGEERQHILFQDVEIDAFPYKIDKIVPLETTGNNFLSDNLKVKFTPDYIFVFDEEIRDAVHQFDLSGQYVGKIISTGESPGKVSRIYDFTVSEKGVELLVGKGSYSEVVVVAIADKKIIEALQLDVIGFSFEKNILEEGWGDIFRHPVAIAGSDKIVFSAHPLNLIRNAVFFEGNQVVKSALRKLENQDNPVLIYSNLQFKTNTQ